MKDTFHILIISLSILRLDSLLHAAGGYDGLIKCEVCSYCKDTVVSHKKSTLNIWNIVLI